MLGAFCVFLRDTDTIKRDRNAQVSMGWALLGDGCIRIGTQLLLFSEVVGKGKIANITGHKRCQSFPALQPVGV